MAIYMEGTKFEMVHFDGPDDMHRKMIMMGIGLTWHQDGDPVKDTENYTESFDLNDNWKPENNRNGMTRAQADQYCYDLMQDDLYNN